MNAFYLKKLKGNIKFHNKAISLNIKSNAGLSQSTDLCSNKASQLNKSESNQWANETEMELRPFKEKEDDLKEHVDEYFENKQSSREPNNNYLHKENGFHKMLQLYLLSNETEPEDQSENISLACPMIKSIYHNSNSHSNLFSKYQQHNEEKSDRKECRIAKSSLHFFKDKLSHIELLTGSKYFEKLTNESNMNTSKSIINNSTVNRIKAIPTKNFQSQFNAKDVRLSKKHNKENYYYLNQHIKSKKAQQGREQYKKYSAIPLIHEMLLKLFRKNKNTINFNNSQSQSSTIKTPYKPNKIQETLKTAQYWHDHQPLFKTNLPERPKKIFHLKNEEICKEKEQSSVIHHSELVLSKGSLSKSFPGSKQKDNRSTSTSISSNSKKSPGNHFFIKRPHKCSIESYCHNLLTANKSISNQLNSISLGESAKTALKHKLLIANNNERIKRLRLGED